MNTLLRFPGGRDRALTLSYDDGVNYDIPLMEILDAEGVGVVIEAQHLCMQMRGVEKQNSFTTTSSMRGSFRSELATRNEFTRLIR